MQAEHLSSRQHQPGVDRGQNAGDDRVGQRPGDDPVDIEQALPEDRDAQGDRNRDQRERKKS
jgi:hypothetical protein